MYNDKKHKGIFIMTKKVIIKTVACLCLLSVLVACFASCSNQLNGTYSTKESIKQTITFKPDNVVVFSAFGIDANGTYKIENGEITITYKVLGVSFDLTKSFEKKGNSIFIDGTEFVK